MFRVLGCWLVGFGVKGLRKVGNGVQSLGSSSTLKIA